MKNISLAHRLDNLRRCLTRRFQLAAILVLIGPAVVPAQTVTTFDAPGAPANTFPIAINLGGTVAGYFQDSTGYHAFLRAPDGTLTAFNAPADVSGSTVLFGLNNPGSVVGTYINGIHTVGYVRDPSGNFTDIVPPGSTLTSANSINDSGVIAGSYVDSSRPSKTHGFVRDTTGNYTSFDMDVTTTGINVVSINNSGQVSGYYGDSTFHNHGFLRDSTGAITTYDAPTPLTDITVYGMNDNGDITGYSKSSSTYHGYLRQGTTISLFDPDPARTVTLPQSINSADTIVGYDCDSSFSNCNGFVRSSLGAITSLMVPNASNTQPDSVNNVGTISGIWLDASFKRHGFIAVLPAAAPPSSGTTCNGTYNQTFTGNITVSAGQVCNFVGGGITGNITLNGGTLGLSNAAVGGNVEITGGTFAIGPSTTIKGNLTISNLLAPSSQSQVCGTTVQGNLKFQNNGTPVQIGADSAACPGNVIHGNLEVHNNTGSTIIAGNTIMGNLQDQNNTAATQVSNNTITGNLQCQNDTSITGSGNSASHKQGQCASF